MILHPGVLALTVGSALTLLLVLCALAVGGGILLGWDYESSSARQLTLERRTCLVSTLVNYGLGFQIASLLLFIYTMDDVHPLFVGAMCATGSLNANPVGWYSLASKLVLFFLSGFWIALNNLDNQAEDYPLVRFKYVLLFALAPLLCLDIYLQFAYFLGLDPDIITSCCGSLFSTDSDSAVSSVTAMPVKLSMALFYGSGLLVVALFGCSLAAGPGGAVSYLFSCAVLCFFLVALVSVISFVSIYIYELPTHHCPFDILQQGYHFIGYPLYLTLFAGTYFGLLPGLFQPLSRHTSLRHGLSRARKKWFAWSMANITAFIILASHQVVTSNLNYFS